MSLVPLPLLRLFVALFCVLPGFAYGQSIVPDVVGSNLGYTFVQVGDPQNPDDDDITATRKDLENGSVGYVGQEFAMGQTEITSAMYARFLNAVAKRDRLYGLYSALMATDPNGGILRSGASGSYAYTVNAGFSSKPANFVSGFDAMRFCNWLHNGMPGDPQAEDPTRRTPLSGDQDAASTEDGAYTLLGANHNELVRRNREARYFLPDQDEWHKAAFYDPDPGIDPATGLARPSESYWEFADQTSVGPGGNFSSPLVLVDGGDSSGPSHYRTYDQDGNVNEWLDATITDTSSAERICAITTFAAVEYKSPTEGQLTENADLGFRIAKRLLPASSELGVTPPLMVEVGEAANLADEEFAPQLGDPKLGAVNYAFQLGAYEVTNREYAKFLNAKAKEDSFYRLFDTRMGSDAASGGIVRSGVNGSYTYTIKSGFAKKPVVYVSIFSAMRYCNWLHNGGRAESDMESGAYRLLGNIPTNTANLTRNATARYYLPNANEFYKAAYYDPSSLADATFDYWKFATRSDTFDMNNNTSTLANVDFSSMASYFGAYGQSGNVGYVSPGSGANAPADEPTAANTGELLEEATNSDDESATRTFRIAAAAGVQSLRPLGDEDSDGMSNAYEIFNDLDPRVNDAAEDPDTDGLTNLQEFRAGTDARNKDTDADGMDDGWEVQYGLNPRADDAAQDPDQDGLTNLQEFQAKTDPKDADTDNDGMGDVWEVQYGFDPKNPSDAAGDPDADGLSNLQEFQATTDPKDADTDNDGLLDGNEVTRGTNPIVADTDGDTLFDGAEVDIHKTDPLKLDTDADGFSDNVELLKLGTDPLSPDLEPIFVLVGDPGNPDGDDPVKDLENDGIGYVGQEFEMGATEVTNFMYARFLNSVAANDSLYGLYSTFMGTDPLGGILRTGSRGNYRYAVKAGYEGRPVNFVSAFDAMRYCNWLHNGMPDTQVQNATTTEDGAYPLLGKNYLDGNVPGDRESVRRSFGARYFLPDEDEWHKAAYFDPEPGASRPNDSYWPFADQTVAGPGGNFSDTPNRPVAGNSASSHYGTYDQDGNISEWTESTIQGGSQLIVKTGSAAAASGPLTLNIDIASNRFWLTGRAQGVFGATQRRAVWAVSPPAQTKDPENQTTNVGIVNDQSAVATLDNNLEIVSVEIGSTVRPGGGFRFALRASGSGPATIIGNGQRASLNTAAVNPGAVLNFWEGVDLTAVFEVGDSTFGPLIVRSVDPNEEAPEASGPKPAETENASLGFRVARPVPPSQAVPAHKPLMVPVGLPGNAADYDGKGAVAYEYQIGAYEVTNEEYAAFLNAVAKSDSAFGLYDIRMGFDGQGGIVRDGAPGSYAYAPKPGHEKKPVTFVSCHDAMRYCNWLHNGALPGADTESGAYRLLGGLPGSTVSISRNFGARYFLPDENEWHKAAYYDPSSKGARTGRYWDFAVRSDNATPSQVIVGGVSGLADVNKPGLASYFGTFGQSGNAAEWTEELSGTARLVLGGGVASDWSDPQAAMAFYDDPSVGSSDRGFRIAARADSPSARMLALQTLKFGKLPAKRVIGTKPLKISLRAKANSNLPVQFEIDDPADVATFHNGPVPYLLISGPGQVSVTARQNGNGTWAPTQVRQTMEIVPRAVRTR